MKTALHYLHIFRLSIWSLALVLFGTAASALTYNVNTTTDGNSSSGPTINLRGALVAADAAGGSHTINVPAGTYNLTLGPITLGTTAQNLTIIGAGTCVINMAGTGSNQDRIFNINPNVISGVATSISGISFTNGFLKSDQYGGGAIVSGGPSCTLSLTGCTFSNNTVNSTLVNPLAGGGAVSFLYGGTLSIDDCTFTSNSISYPATVSAADVKTGGAIYFYVYGVGSVYPNAALTITDSRFTGNSIANDGSGGAIFIRADNSTSTPTITTNILRNTFVTNSA